MYPGRIGISRRTSGYIGKQKHGTGPSLIQRPLRPQRLCGQSASRLSSLFLPCTAAARTCLPRHGGQAAGRLGRPPLAVLSRVKAPSPMLAIQLIRLAHRRSVKRILRIFFAPAGSGACPNECGPGFRIGRISRIDQRAAPPIAASSSPLAGSYRSGDNYG